MIGSRLGDLDLGSVFASMRGLGEMAVPKLRIIQTRCTLRIAVFFEAKVVTISCKYDIGCVMPIPPATKRRVPYEASE